MGFHIIKQKDGIIDSVYIRKSEDLINIDDIDENTIVYEADEKWKPFQIRDNSELLVFLKESVKYGLLGQKYFEEIMHENKIVCEQIKQDQESLKQYIEIANGEFIKRGDYILRNLSNIEVEVKVRKFYENNKVKYFSIDYHELKSLERMERCLKNTIVFCIFQKIDTEILTDIIYSISVKKIVELNKLALCLFE